MRMSRLRTLAGAVLAGVTLWATGCQEWARAEEAPDKPKETAPAAPASEPAGKESEPAAQPSEPSAAEIAPAAKESAKEADVTVKPILLEPAQETSKAPAAAKSRKTAAKTKDVATTLKDAVFAINGMPGKDLDIDENEDHRIAPTETIKIDVYGERELTVQELRVQAGGQVKYFLLGDVQVGGLTAREAANSIRKQLMDGQYLQDPQVIVTVVQYRKRYVYVLGDVNKPGAVTLDGENRYTIPDVIGQAGGLTHAAKKNKIQFIRQGKIETLDLDKLNKTTDRKSQIFVEPNDTIYVPQSVW